MSTSISIFIFGSFLIILLAFSIFGKKLTRKQKIIGAILVYAVSYFTSLVLFSFILVSEESIAWIAMSVLPSFLYSTIAIRYLKKQNARLPHKKESTQKKRQSHEKSKKNKDAHIFISYRRADSENVTGRIYDRLVQHYGKEPVFKDVDSIPLGVDFRTFLDEKVGQCQVLLAIIGDQWATITDDSGNRRLDNHQDFVRIEIESAIKRKIPVIPLLVRRATMPIEEQLPIEIQGLAFRNGIQIRPDPDFHKDMERLISALDIALGL